jgi:YD repeat-containing protein
MKGYKATFNMKCLKMKQIHLKKFLKKFLRVNRNILIMQPKLIMKGYKATFNMKCRNLTYEVGKTYEIDSLEMCDHGFHFCEKMEDVLDYYGYNKDFVLLEVEAIGDTEHEGDKTVTNKLKVIRVVPKEEYTFDIPYEKYDSNGNLIHSKNSSGYEELYEYDSNGNLIHFKNSGGSESWYEYDDDGNQIYCKLSNIHESWNEYDADGNVIYMKTDKGYETRFVYDSNGNMIYNIYSNEEFKGWKGVERWYEYDSNGNMIHYKDSKNVEWNITITI